MDNIERDLPRQVATITAVQQPPKMDIGAQETTGDTQRLSTPE